MRHKSIINLIASISDIGAAQNLYLLLEFWKILPFDRAEPPRVHDAHVFHVVCPSDHVDPSNLDPSTGAYRGNARNRKQNRFRCVLLSRLRLASHTSDETIAATLIRKNDVAR